MVKRYIILLVAFSCSCEPTIHKNAGIDYYQDSSISDKKGNLIDTSRYYFPSEFMQDSTAKELQGIDTFKLQFYSGILRCFKEPILYNYYLGNEVLRFLWVRSFDKPILITVKLNKTITVNTKMLKSFSDCFIQIYLPGNSPNSKNIFLSNNLESIKSSFPFADSIVLPRYDTGIVLDTTYVIKKSQWNNLLALVDSCDFWELKPFNMTLGHDGAYWILEAQTKEKYQFVERWSPNDSFSKCCEYIIKLSAAKNEEIY